MSLHIWQLQPIIDSISRSGGCFMISFVKTDGSIREMIASQNTRSFDKKTGEINKKANFGYNLNENYILLLKECEQFKRSKKNIKEIGTVDSIENPPHNLAEFRHNDIRMEPKSVKLYSILSFNGQPVYA